MVECDASITLATIPKPEFDVAAAQFNRGVPVTLGPDPFNSSNGISWGPFMAGKIYNVPKFWAQQQVQRGHVVIYIEEASA
jgi:hypothetical protein